MKINDEFDMEWDGHCWNLNRKVPINKDHRFAKGNKDHKTVTTYYPNMEQACIAVLEKSLEGCDSIMLLLSKIEEAKSEIVKAVSKR